MLRSCLVTFFLASEVADLNSFRSIHEVLVARNVCQMTVAAWMKRCLGRNLVSVDPFELERLDMDMGIRPNQ